MNRGLTLWHRGKISWRILLRISIIVVMVTDTNTERKPPAIQWEGGEDERGRQKCYSNFTIVQGMDVLEESDENFCIVKIVNLRPQSLVERGTDVPAIFIPEEMNDTIFGSWSPTGYIPWCFNGSVCTGTLRKRGRMTTM